MREGSSKDAGSVAALKSASFAVAVFHPRISRLLNEAVKFFADHTKGTRGARTVLGRINLFLIQNRSLDDDRGLNQYLFCYTGS